MRAPSGYQDDQGIGWFLLYLISGLPLGLVALTQTDGWGPAIGLALITYFWWPTWLQAAKRAHHRPPTVRR